MSTQNNFTWREGEAATLTFTEPSTDITGWSITLEVRENWEGSAVLTKSTGGGGVTLSDPANGEFQAAFTSSDTAGLRGSYVYDVRRTDAGSEAVLAHGYLEIEPSTF